MSASIGSANPRARPNSTRRPGWRRHLLAVALMSPWVILPLSPVLAVLLTWWLGLT